MGNLQSALYALTICVAISGCGPAVTFNEPQPVNTKSLASFPQRLQGKYLSKDESSVLTISEDLVTRTFDYNYKAHKDSIGMEYKISGDSLIKLSDGKKEKIQIEGDSIVQHVNWTDTLFKIGDDGVFKRFKGYYFLNSRFDSTTWVVQKLSLKNGILTTGNISSKEDIQNLKEITETTTDTLSKQLNLTRKQFKHFVRQHGFSDEETFTKIE